MSMYNTRRRGRLLSTGSLYVDIDKEERQAFKEMDKDEHQGELEWKLKSLREDFKYKGNDVLFKNFQSRLQHRCFTILLMFNMIVNFVDSFWYFFYKTDFSFPFPAMLRLTALIVYISFLCLAHHNEKWFRPAFARTIASIAVLWAMIYAEYGGFLFTLSGDESFKWKRLRPVYYLIICNELLLPFPSRIYSVLATIVIILLEITVTLVWPHVSDSNCQSLTPDLTMDSKLTFLNYYDRFKYMASDLFFYICAACIAYYVTYLLEIVNRRAFLDHRRCVESKLKLNFEKDQQERLLGSCLPQHLMKKVRTDIRDRFDQYNDLEDQQDIKASISRPTELYIEKYKNVTILYADIVNSMLLTQSFDTPQQLVSTLNGLFTSFDTHAEANKCLRIKLLGDCYYCVSGIPEYDEHHALNSINMGIDMIDTIKEFRDENEVNVDMRIGVHSGMVFSGLLGLKKWQYDIWSIDSMKASTMEHEGKPGYVHVTKETLDLVPKHMRSQFHIKENNKIPYETTYLIRKIRSLSTLRQLIKQNSRSDRLIEKARPSVNSRNSSISSRSSSRVGSLSLLHRRTTVSESEVGAFVEILNTASQDISTAIDKMPLNLKTQYDCSNTSLEINPHLLHFIPKNKASNSPFRRIHTLDIENEKLYFQESDPMFPFYLYCSAFISIVIMTIRFLTLYDEHTDWDTFWYTNGTIVFYLVIAIIVISLYIIQRKNYELNYFCRILIWFSISFLLVLIACLDCIQCPVYDKMVTQEKNMEHLDVTSNGDHECLYKWSRYYTYSTVLALTSISMFIRINLWLKFILATVSLIIINSLTQNHSCSVFLKIDAFYNNQNVKELEFFTPRLAHMQYLFVVYLMFYIIDRQIEYILRLDFLWSIKLKHERKEAQITRNVNQLLLKNMLPIHVAERYLFNNPDTINDELYYEAYNDSIAVMFASIPNFFKFYNRKSLIVKDDGLQFLEILNKIICDFDRLLTANEDFTNKIEKIKTIGSTYMAAAGLQPGRRSTDSFMSSEEECENLVVLVKFALAMIKTLRKFNANHDTDTNFKLRVGIAMGPVVAGVVGSVKPQYDIWGDTVNVASRMDTHGKDDRIHVTEEVAKMLMALNFDYKPKCIGSMDIKGKGLMTTYLIDYPLDFIEEEYGII